MKKKWLVLFIPNTKGKIIIVFWFLQLQYIPIFWKFVIDKKSVINF